MGRIGQIGRMAAEGSQISGQDGSRIENEDEDDWTIGSGFYTE